jgi:hypothetical protein
VVDRGFLIWLNYQDRTQLMEDLDLPTDPVLPEGLEMHALAEPNTQAALDLT